MSREGGFALAAAMMVLALLSVLGVAAIQSTTLEVKISAHDRDARAALYVAQAALEEARYFAARGWGKIDVTATPPIPAQVEVTVTNEIPAEAPWDTDLYTGFTLVDEVGRSFTVTASNSDRAAPRITVDTSAGTLPRSGRFVLVRESFLATWDGSELRVGDDAWALASTTPDVWRGWSLWRANGSSFGVAGSDRDSVPSPAEVLLTPPAGVDPCAPNAPPCTHAYTMTLHPWLATLDDAAQTVEGDADANPGAWDRVFADPGGGTLGTAAVTADGDGDGGYDLTATGTAGPATRRVALTVQRAGRRDQRTADWVVR